MQRHKYQKQLVKNNPDLQALVWEMGTGKTLASIDWAKLSDGKTCIICPKIAKTNWINNLKEQDFESATVLTKEYFRDHYEEIEAFDSLIIDEAHYFLGTTSKMRKNLMKYIKKNKVMRILALTATPYLSTPHNIRILGNILSRNSYRWSYPYFDYTYFNRVQMGTRVVPVVKKDADDLLGEKIKQIASVCKLSDIKEIPESVVLTEYFSLHKKQEKAIKEAKENALSRIAGWTAQHQIENGTLKGDGYTETQVFPSEKRERLLDILKEKDKVIVSVRYNAEINTLKEVIEKQKGSPKVYIINGQVKENYQDIVDKASKQKRAVILLSAYISEAFNAPEFDTVIFYTLDFSFKNYYQTKGRIQRLSNIQKCTYIHFVIEKGVDQAVYESVVIKKQRFSLKIYERKNSTD